VLKPRLTAALTLVVTGALLASCSSGSPKATPSPSVTVSQTPPPEIPGVTDSTITIGSHQPLTGILAPGYAQIAPAAKAYFDYINDHGGVAGRKIQFEYQDDQSSPTRTKSIVKSYLDSRGVLAIFNGQVSVDHAAVASDLASGGVPDLFVGGGCGCWNSPVTMPLTFGFDPDVVAEGKVLAADLMARYPGVPIGVLYQNDAYGQAGLQGVRAVVPPALLVDTESYSTTNASLASQVGTLRAKQAGIVISFSVSVFTAELLLTASDLGYAPHFAVSRGGSDPTAVFAEVTKQSANRPVPKTVAFLDGIVTDSFLPSPDDATNPWIALFRTVQAGAPAISGQPFTAQTAYGMAAAETLVQALRAAGPALTRASLVSALEGLTLSPAGPALASVTLSPTYHGGFTAMQIGVITAGQIVQSGPLVSTDAAGAPISPVAAAAPVVPVLPTPTPTAAASATTAPTAPSRG